MAIIDLVLSYENLFRAAIIIALLYLYCTWTHNIFSGTGIPGPKPGLLGIIPSYLTKGVHIVDPELVRKYGRVVGVFHAREPVVLVADPEIVREICVKQAFPHLINRKMPFPLHRLFGKSLSLLEDDEWKFVRSVVGPTFSSSKLREMLPLVQKACDNMVRNGRRLGKDGKSVDMKTLFGAFSMDAIASTGFGLEVDSHSSPDHPFCRHARRACSFTFNLPTALAVLLPFLKPVFQYLDWTTQPKDSVEFFVSVTKAAIKQRTSETAQQNHRDLLQLMLNAHREMPALEEDQDPDELIDTPPSSTRRLSEEVIVSNSVLFLLAGFDTTSTSLAFLSLLLAAHPECQEKIAQEIRREIRNDPLTFENVSRLQYLDNVLCESLRLYPPSTRFNRRVDADTTIRGFRFPRGSEVHVATYVMHHDPEFWPDPEKFDPDRFLPEQRAMRNPYCFNPFGIGPRSCVGMRLAKMEVKMAVVALLQNFRFRMAAETEMPPVLEKGAGFVRPKAVLLKLEPLETSVRCV